MLASNIALIFDRLLNFLITFFTQSNATSPVNGTSDANSTKSSDSETIKVEVNIDATDSAEDSAAPTIEEQGEDKNEEL